MFDTHDSIHPQHICVSNPFESDYCPPIDQHKRFEFLDIVRIGRYLYGNGDSNNDIQQQLFWRRSDSRLFFLDGNSNDQ